MYIRKYTYLDGAITAPKAPKLSVYRVASRGVAKKRANRNKSLDISEATRRGTRRAARGDRNGEGEGEQAQRDVRTFLIYERAYFLGLLHMDISSGTERCEPRRMRESAEQRPRGTLMLVPSSFRLAAQFFLSFSLFFSLSPLLWELLLSTAYHTLIRAMMYYDHAWKVEGSGRDEAKIRRGLMDDEHEDLRNASHYWKY